MGSTPLTRIFFIGGSPCSGKSSVAAAIAAKHDFAYFKVDDHLERYLTKGHQDGKPVCSRVSMMTADQIWMREPAIQMVEELEIYRKIFAYIDGDLRDMQNRTGMAGIIAEGAAFLPELMEQRGVGRQTYVCMIPTFAFQLEHYRRRSWVDSVLSDCMDKEQAFANWMARDGLFAQAIQSNATEKGYPCIITDGTAGIDELACQVSSIFGLPRSDSRNVR